MMEHRFKVERPYKTHQTILTNRNRNVLRYAQFFIRLVLPDNVPRRQPKQPTTSVVKLHTEQQNTLTLGTKVTPLKN